jgi:hypothetical protein
MLMTPYGYRTPEPWAYDVKSIGKQFRRAEAQLQIPQEFVLLKHGPPNFEIRHRVPLHPPMKTLVQWNFQAQKAGKHDVAVEITTQAPQGFYRLTATVQVDEAPGSAVGEELLELGKKTAEDIPGNLAAELIMKATPWAWRGVVAWGVWKAAPRAWRGVAGWVRERRAKDTK